MLVNKGMAKKLEKDLVDLARGRRRAGSVYREHMDVYNQFQQKRQTKGDSSVSGSVVDDRMIEEGEDDLLDNDSEDSSDDEAVLKKEISTLQVRLSISLREREKGADPILVRMCVYVCTGKAKGYGGREGVC